VQGFIGVNIAQPGKESLVEQERLKLPLAVVQVGIEPLGSECLRERFRPEIVEEIRQTRPNLRGSQKTRLVSSERWAINRSWLPGWYPPSTTSRSPLMRRWIKRLEWESSKMRNFARREIAVICWPWICRLNFSGEGSASVRLQRRSTDRMVLPTSAGRRVRAMVSTSGSSGMICIIH
jgi:hypothetical protein